MENLNPPAGRGGDVCPGDIGRLDSAITAYTEGFAGAVAALDAIRREGLFAEAGFGSFKEFCARRYGIQDKTCRRWARAHEVFEGLREAGVEEIPTNTTQVRELGRLRDAADQVRAWERAKAAAGSRFPTGVHVRLAVDELLGDGAPPYKDPPAPRAAPHRMPLADGTAESYPAAEGGTFDPDRLREGLARVAGAGATGGTPAQDVAKVQKKILALAANIDALGAAGAVMAAPCIGTLSGALREEENAPRG